MTRGRPFQPGNKFGRGRPKGSQNRKTLILQELLDEHAPALLRKSLVLALQGDGPLLRMLLASRLPRVADVPVKIGHLLGNTAEELLQSHQILLNKIASREITPTQALQVSTLLNTQRQFVETHDLANRILALEQLQQK